MADVAHAPVAADQAASQTQDVQRGHALDAARVAVYGLAQADDRNLAGIAFDAFVRQD